MINTCCILCAYFNVTEEQKVHLNISHITFHMHPSWGHFYVTNTSCELAKDGSCDLNKYSSINFSIRIANSFKSIISAIILPSVTLNLLVLLV